MWQATWIIGAIPVAVTIVLWLIDRFAALRKNIAYRVHVNAPIAVTPSTADTRVDVPMARWDTGRAPCTGSGSGSTPVRHWP